MVLKGEIIVLFLIIMVQP